MDINPIILSIPLYFLLIGIELLIQVFSKQQIYRLNDAISNISCGITQQLFGALTKVLLVVIYQYIYEYWSLFHLPVTWWSVMFLALGVDLCYYWAHRMSHEVNLFWGGHVVHHQSEDYNFSVALRQGSFQGLWTLWFYLPLAILGFDTITFMLVLALNTVYQFWIHTETIKRLPRPIEYIFNTPSHHRVHHGRDPKYIDKNHGGSLIIWDRMFGTFQQEEERPNYGITTPVHTWNPVRANLDHYVTMWQDIKKAEGWDGLKIMIFPPGWNTPSQGEHAPANTRAKYDAHPGRRLALYVLLQFIIILGMAAGYLFMQEQLDVFVRTAVSLFIVWSVAQMGLIMESNPAWSRMEYLRLGSLAVFGIYLNTDYYTMALASTFAIGSMVLFNQYLKAENRRKNAKIPI